MLQYLLEVGVIILAVSLMEYIIRGIARLGRHRRRF